MSHHHHQHHHHSNNQNSSHCFNPPSSCHCGTSSCCCSATSSSDHQQLLQTLTTQLLFLQAQPQPHLFINTPHPHHQQAPKPKPKTKTNPFNNNINNDDDPSLLPLLRSLLRRVAAIESNLSSNLAISQQPPAQQYQRHSLKHLAAATIQRYFRRFLARRSQTLRHLKLLASIKSTVAALRSSLADKTLKNPRALSTQVADLLSKLDSIQSSDAMIREGKRAIQRDLVRVSEFVDKVLVREREVRELGEMERRRERGRRVRFVENGDEEEMFEEMLDRDLRERGRRARFVENGDGDEDEVFDEMLRSEKESQRFYEMFADGVVWNGSNRLSPPLPVKMDA